MSSTKISILLLTENVQYVAQPIRPTELPTNRRIKPSLGSQESIRFSTWCSSRYVCIHPNKSYTYIYIREIQDQHLEALRPFDIVSEPPLVHILVTSRVHRATQRHKETRAILRLQTRPAARNHTMVQLLDHTLVNHHLRTTLVQRIIINIQQPT